MDAKEYATTYPLFCRTCGGIGGHKKPGAFLPTECTACFGQGMCGRCSTELPKFSLKCLRCNWTAFNLSDAMPGLDFG